MAEKVHQYLAAGARLVWIVDPQSRTVMVHQPGGGEATVVKSGGELDGGAVLPGFALAIEALFTL
jgi:Uma2 family endonuclease